MKTSQLPRITQSKSTITLSIKVFAALFATLVIFHQDMIIVANDALQNEFMSYILAIPFLFSYLIYRKRKIMRAAISIEPSPSHRKAFPYKEIVGMLLFLIAFLTYSYGSYTFTPLEYHMFALPIFVAACTLIMFNTQTLRQLAFPILFLLFLMPPPTEIVYALGSTLSTISTEATCAILNLFGFVAKVSVAYGNPMITVIQPDGKPLSFSIDIACSGVYSLIGFLIFATFITYVARTKAWKKPAIFLIGLPLIYLLNILRITIIILLGYYHSMELAMNTFHLFGGWVLIFLGTLLLLIITENVLKIHLFTRKENISCPECNPLTEHKQDFCSSCGRLLKYVDFKLEKRDLVKIAAILISVVFIISIQAPTFALTKGPADILTQLAEGKQPTTKILPQVNDCTLRFEYRDRKFEQEAKQDASLIYAYVPTNSSRGTIWTVIEIASTKSSLHDWEYCLITIQLRHGWQPSVTQLDLRDIQLLQNPPLIARYFAFQNKNNNITQVILYWYETSKFITNTTTQQKHVKISLIMYPHEEESIQQAEDQLLIFGKAVAGHWQPLKTWTEIALLISKNGNYLLLIPTTLLITTILFQTFTQIKTKQKNLKAYKKFSKQDKAILEATHQTKTMPTTANIATTYEKQNHKPIPTNKLARRLQQIQQIGLVKKEIINIQDEPVLGWKTQLPSK